MLVLSFDAYIEKVMELVRGLLDDSVEVVATGDVMKNNGVVEKGLYVCVKASSIKCTIYLNEEYHEYFLTAPDYSEEDFKRVAKWVVSCYKKSTKEHSLVEAFLKKLQCFEKVKEQVYPMLLNKKSNEEMFKARDIVYLETLDMAIVYYVNGIGLGTVKISHRMLEDWGVSKEELHELAFDNLAHNNSMELGGITDKVVDALMAKRVETLLFSEFDAVISLFSDVEPFSAVHICRDSVLREIAEGIGDDLFIVPLSIHDVAIVPMEFVDDCKAFCEKWKEQLENMVVNDELDREDVLSSSCYIYIREEHALKVA